MPLEIERRFLVDPEGDWRLAARKEICRQGYILTQAPCSMRVRIMGDQAYLTIKSQREGIAREEFEYPIPLEDANHMLDHYCHEGQICKRRYYVPFDGLTWEVDVFEGPNQGLILAEVELDHVNQEFRKPDWVRQEISGDARYFNASLALNPYQSWAHEPDHS